MGNSVGEGIWDKHPVIKKDNKMAAKAAKSADEARAKSINKGVTKITGVKPKGFKKSVTPTASKWTGGRAVNNAKANATMMDTIKPLSAADKISGDPAKIDGVRTIKAGSKPRTSAGITGSAGRNVGGVYRSGFTGSSSGKVGITYTNK